MTKPNRHKGDDFATWAMPHMDYVYTASRYLTVNDQEAADLLQETFLKAFRGWHQFTRGTNCRAWLLKILHDTFNDRYHGRLREQRALECDESSDRSESSDAADNHPADNGPAEVVLSEFLDSEVERALRSLPIAFRETLVLVDLQELTYEEAATACGCPIETVRSRLSRARRQLQETLRRDAMQCGSGRRSYAVR